MSVSASAGRRQFLGALAAALSGASARATAGPPFASQEGTVYRGGVEVVTVGMTVTDESGRLVLDLTRDELEVLEDGVPQPITQFSTERVPVSLCLLLDISDSMAGQRYRDAREAIDRFLFQLLAPTDEYAIVLFNHQPLVVARWTTDPGVVRARLDEVRPWGGTAVYDAVAASIPLFDGRNRQRAAAVIISDGADTASDINVQALRRRLIRCDAFVYAIGIDRADPRALATRISPYALREITDDSGGYTAIIHDTPELAAATEKIADELNRQYTLGYVQPKPPDDQFHSIRVRAKRPGLRVRARRGYIATPRRQKRS